AGTLDDPSLVEPDVHIFTKSKLDWVGLPDSVPAFEVYYDRKALWPAASLELLDAILAYSSAVRPHDDVAQCAEAHRRAPDTFRPRPAEQEPRVVHRRHEPCLVGDDPAIDLAVQFQPFV